MKAKLTKAVFPVAGIGSRFLPATKASPKEMMPIVDKPLIQYAVEEAVEAGITDMIFITGRNKRTIEDHFDKAYEVESELAAQGKTELLEMVRSVIPRGINCIYIRQAEALGLGHAVLCARPVVNDEPFAVILADDLIDGKPPVIRQMTDMFDRHGCSVLGVEEIPREQTRQYGIVSFESVVGGVDRITAIVEKPEPAAAPSNLAVVGRYVLTPRIFHHLERVTAGAGGEIQLTDAMIQLSRTQPFYGLKFEGRSFDCGSKIGFLTANVAYALERPDIAPEFRKEIERLLK